MKKTYEIEVDCANCANLCEKAAGNVDGAANVVINYMTQKMTVEFAEDADVNTVMKAIRKACCKIEPDFDIQL